MRVHVLFHDNCFDGIASAATFTRFYRERIDPNATFTYRGLSHRPGTSFTPDVFTDAEVHACVDFRYSSSPKLTWWFDHHQSAFETPEDEAHFRSEQNERHFLDTKAKSCTRFIARTTSEKFGFDPTPLSELIHWAEIIDSASFPDPETAVALEEPAMKLMLLAEATKDPDLLPRIIRELVDRPLSEVMEEPWIQEPLGPLYEAHLRTVELVKERARLDGGVVTFDLADEQIDNFNKFISYYLYPEATYTVAVSAGPRRSKVSVGSNPWAPEKRRHNIAEICERYGGGGHPVVGAVSYAPDAIETARRTAAEIADRLRS